MGCGFSHKSDEWPRKNPKIVEKPQSRRSALTAEKAIRQVTTIAKTTQLNLNLGKSNADVIKKPDTPKNVEVQNVS